MIHAYSADYLTHAQQTLGGMLLAGVYLFDVPADVLGGMGVCEVPVVHGAFI